MRVGANARQYARIKKMWKEGTPPHIIAKTIQLTDQSLEKILAKLENRPEKTLAIEENPEVQALRIENAELLAKLAKQEADNGEGPTEEVDAQEEVDASEEIEDDEEVGVQA